MSRIVMDIAIAIVIVSMAWRCVGPMTVYEDEEIKCEIFDKALIHCEQP